MYIHRVYRLWLFIQLYILTLHWLFALLLYLIDLAKIIYSFLLYMHYKIKVDN